MALLDEDRLDNLKDHQLWNRIEKLSEFRDATLERIREHLVYVEKREREIEQALNELKRRSNATP